MREYPNVLKKSLEKDEEFNKEIQAAVVKLFESNSESIFKNKNFDAKLINVDELNRYLLVKDSEFNVMAVYHENIHEYNTNSPFKYALEALAERGDVYYDRVISFSTIKDPKAERNDHIRAIYEKHGMDKAVEELGIDMSELLSVLTDTKSLMRYRNGKYYISSSPYAINSFCEFVGVNRDMDFWAKHSEELNELLQGQISDILINVNYLFDVAKEQKFNEKNRFDYNDLDNHLWQVGKGIALDDQNLGFYCVKKENDLTIYAWDRGSNNSKKHTELKDLIAEIKNGQTDLIDTVALKIENGKATFVDNALIYSLVLDIQGTKNALVDEGYGEPKFPVDIYSYGYQLAYYQKKYGYDEFSFMNQAIMTLGSGFDYDNKTGRFYDYSVTYDPSVGNYEAPKEIGKPTHIYGYPKDFTILDSDWQSAIKRMLTILKEDRPLPIKGNTEKEKNKNLDEIIKFYEDGLAKLNPKVVEDKPQVMPTKEQIIDVFKKQMFITGEMTFWEEVQAKEFVEYFEKNYQNFQPKKVLMQFDKSVDVRSYEYQLAYYQKHLNMTEFQFLDHALLTLGSCFTYDQKKGRFYNNEVVYEDGLVLLEDDHNKEATAIYGCPTSFNKLDESWTKAVNRMIEIMERDRPLPLIGENDEDKNARLDSIINTYKEFLSNSPKKPKKKM